MNHHHHHVNATVGEVVILVLCILTVVYYLTLVVRMCLDDYKTRREFYLDLIPFRSLVMGLVNAFTKLK